MKPPEIRDASQSDFDAICLLNLAEVQHTSQMDSHRLLELHRLASFHKVACVNGVIVAFILAMRSDALYENDNFNWFSRRYHSFIYVDRIVVSSTSRGLRLGSLLYDELFRYAKYHSIPLITCEYNIDPPNEASRMFHDKFGFKEQGTQWVANGTKRVSLQTAEERFN